MKLRIVTAGPDGSPRRAVPVWVIADGADLYRRCASGSGSAWHRRHGTGYIDRMVAPQARNATLKITPR